MTIIPVISLPGDIKFADTTGLVWGTGHCALKDARYGRDNKTMTSIKSFGEFGEFETRTGRKKTLEISLEGMSEEVEALLTGGDVVVGEYVATFSEVIGPAIAGVFPALTNLPVMEGSEVVRKTSDTAGKVVTERLKFVTAAPGVDEYSIVNATGVITTDGAYILHAVVNYAQEDAAAGTKIVEDDAADIPLMDIIIICRAWEPVMQKKGSAVFRFPACELIQEPGQTLAAETASAETIRFNVSGLMEKSIHFA